MVQNGSESPGRPSAEGGGEGEGEGEAGPYTPVRPLTTTSSLGGVL